MITAPGLAVNVFHGDRVCTGRRCRRSTAMKRSASVVKAQFRRSFR
jgi:hypothetical protein